MAFALVAVLIGYFAGRITDALRQREQELTLAREQAARSEQLASSGDAKEDAKLIRQEVERCRAILDRMRVDMIEGLRQAVSSVPLEELIDRLRDGLPDEERHRLQVQSLQPLKVVTGPVRAIELAVLVLLRNAFDASPDEKPVRLEIRRTDDGRTMFTVVDQGTGMPEEVRRRAGRPFFTTKAPGKGSGLGLATVYGAIKQNEGDVTVYSQPGCGTIFEIYLPRVKEVAVEVANPRSAKGSETILLVDDEEGVRKLVFAVLKSNGYDVLEAANGVAALGVYEKNGHKVDMVLTDVVMPQMNGFELGRQIGERAPGMKILYMSGYRDNAIGSAGGDMPRAFLHKPFTPDVLLSKVREVLDAGVDA
jgi:CheY-like chemotaxis protein/two-component sensor histidine kinase